MSDIEETLRLLAAKARDNERRISKLECAVWAIIPAVGTPEMLARLNEVMKKHHPGEWKEAVDDACESLNVSEVVRGKLGL